jgi:hypothetical protein
MKIRRFIADCRTVPGCGTITACGIEFFPNFFLNVRAMKSAMQFFLLGAISLLLACNSSPEKPAGAYHHPLQPVGKIIAAADMTGARGGQAAAFLPDFKVMITGGKDDHGQVLATTEVYDPTRATFSPGAKMHMPREGHLAVVLGDSKILVFGGATTGGTALDSSEDYDIEVGKFTPRGNMHARRYHAAGLVLRDGRVLVTGGADGAAPLASAEVYSVLTGKWTSVGKMSAARAEHTATMLKDGRVLIVGGWGRGHAALAARRFSILRRISSRPRAICIRRAARTPRCCFPTARCWWREGLRLADCYQGNHRERDRRAKL